MILSKYTLKHITSDAIDAPDNSTFELPEKVLQFGTGVLLRGLPDYFINKANNKQIFNGRIVVVKSTNNGDAGSFAKQDGLYTVCVRGIMNGAPVSENIVNSSISRVLSAQDDWKEILACASDPNFQVIISNTTEVGIQLINEDIHKHPPASYPGKLLAFLYERYKAFSGSNKSGMIIIPTELITGNGKLLESIILELAHLNGLEDGFIEWLEASNHFCNSLVDRIVPGKPETQILSDLENELGYSDELLIMAEAYTLWAIEGDEKLKEVLTFSSVDAGVVITPDINIYRELKLRILNGAHTLSCAIAYLSGITTVKQAMDSGSVSNFISNVIYKDIIPSIPYSIEEESAISFAEKVLDRFRNPDIKHFWLSISVQYSSKMKLRVIPMIAHHYSKSGNCPKYFALGFAAYLAFTKPVRFHDNKYFGLFNSNEYLINDDYAPVLYNKWQTLNADGVIQEVLKDSNYWGVDLHLFPGFQAAVAENLKLILAGDINELLATVNSSKQLA